MSEKKLIEWLKHALEAPTSTSIAAYRTVLRNVHDHFEKYRWHDLRKDPDDLPEQEGMVLVSLNGKIGSVSYVHAVESRYYIPGAEPFYGDPYMNGLVEAWKEIEPFEEEDE